MDCRTFDIGCGGVGIESAEIFPAAAVLAVALQAPALSGVPAKRIMGGKASVVFQMLSFRHYRTGFEWISPSEELLAALEPWTIDA